ncbi:MAG: hypothetical protein JSU61_04190 [Fidelibacterota bacterium]|nr:MAG: hypothetical protein JSU61_04190 [Candidatus Neomarinimicrobiota bacterium]
MKRLSRIPFSLLSGLLLLSCEPEEDHTGEFRYPLKVGNTWEYTREMKLYIYEDMDSTGAPVYIDTSTFTHLVTNTVTERTTLQDTLQAYAIHSEPESLGAFAGTQYYDNRDDGLYSYAYSGGGSLLLPKRMTSTTIRFKGMSFSDVQAMSTYLQNIIPYSQVKGDSLYFNDPSRKVIQYPLEVGAHWMLSTRYIKIDKEVTGKESIRVPAGNFDCWIIQWLYDMNHDEQWDEDITIFDYVCRKGLIKRVLVAEGVEITTIEDPFGSMGGKQADVHDEAVLTDMTVE